MGELLEGDTTMTLAERLSQLTWGGAGYPSYEGRLDRAAQGMAKNAAKTAGEVAGQEGSAATNERAALTPFFSSEMRAKHAFDPTQTAELLNYAGAGTAGSGATALGEAKSQAARTRNTSGFTPALDQNARDRAREMAMVNAGVGAQDVMGAKALNQEGAAGMSGLYNTDTNAMLRAMGIQTGDINAETEASKSGWFQNMLGAVNAGANLIKSLKSGGSGGGGDSYNT